ncbi:hypothetical protein MMC19_001471 [Ptychographa xylographoides]|nr:hypothetical protein [Ptychographa xylographoides]
MVTTRSSFRNVSDHNIALRTSSSSEASDHNDVTLLKLVDQEQKHANDFKVASNLHSSEMRHSVDRVPDNAVKPLAEWASSTCEAEEHRLSFGVDNIEFVDHDAQGNEVRVKDPERAQALFATMFGSTETSDRRRKPFDAQAVRYIVEAYRGGLFLGSIIDELDDLGWVLPGQDVVDKILEANGMSRTDEHSGTGPNGFYVHQGNTWGELVIPDGIL